MIARPRSEARRWFDSRRWFDARARSDSGAVSSMIAVLGFAIFVSLALVVDGGRQLAALSEARDIADNAARFGTQEVDLDEWRDTGRPVINQSEAGVRVAEFFSNHVTPGRANGRVVPSTGPDADITVTVEVTIRPVSFFFPARDAVVTESATALDGVVNP